MICQIYGKIIQKSKESIHVELGGIVYEIMVPSIIMQRIQNNISDNGMIKLMTYHYLQVEPTKSKPFLIGFLTEVEKEFFEQFITVSGIGPRAAIKALNRPISEICRAIDEGDLTLLSSLPGIGRQKSREIVAKLQGKIGKYGLIQDRESLKEAEKEKDLESEVLQVLLKLQYKKSEAKEMIKRALKALPQAQSAEEILNQIYRDYKQI